MSEILIDIRKYDLADRLKVDYISVENLLRELEDTLDEIENLKEQLEEKEPDDMSDYWYERVRLNEE